jgi:transmembrane sensor
VNSVACSTVEIRLVIGSGGDRWVLPRRCRSGPYIEMTKGNGSGARLSRVENEAVAWTQKLASGEATPEEIAAAARWRAESPAHEAAFDAAERVWREVGAARTVLHDPGIDYAAALDGLGQRRKKVSRRMMLGGGAATVAAVAAYGIARPPMGLWPSMAQLTADFRTDAGEQRKMEFAGDVAINLNSRTSLAIRPATASEDRVELITGEASFEMKKAGLRSFCVIAGTGRASTGAGRFDIRYVTDGDRSPVTVTCFDGRVRVELDGAVADLSSGQRVRYSEAGLSAVTAIDPVAESNWQRGIVEFRNTPIAEVVAEINRYRPGRIVLLNGDLAQKQINGRFQIGEMDEVLVQLQQAVNAKLRFLPGGLVLLS